MSRRISWCGVSAAASLVAFAGRQAQGQSPPPVYYTGLRQFYDGQYNEAEKSFQSAARGCIKTAQSRWIDSICYETMWGECFYQTGDLDSAVQHYTSALELVKRFPDWLTLVWFGPTIRPANASARKIVPWGASKRQTALGTYPQSMPILFGQTATIVDNNTIVPQANMITLGVQEIVRCTTLALRRRAMILGPVSKYDPLSNELVSVLNRTIAPANHWSQCWADLERALALIGAGRESQAGTLLQQAVTAGGEFDHPMTGIALLELGRLALVRGDYSAAATFFEEATYSAVNYPEYYPDWGVLEEAFRYRMLTHLISGNRGYFAPIDEAIGWAKRARLHQLQASLALLAAENHAVLGQTRQATAMLDEARLAIGVRRKTGGLIGGRLSYLAALVAFQQGRVTEGNAALADAMAYMQRGSLWLYQIAVADNMNGTITSRASLDLYAEVLRDPRPTDWLMDPMESLALLTTPNPKVYDNWFEAAAGHNDVKESYLAVEIAERARRHRFFTSLRFDARLESLRWILEAPLDRLPHEAVLQRQDLLARYPAYDQLSQKARAVRAGLGKQPLVAEDPAALKEQTRDFGELAAVSQHQEAVLREIALRREPAQLVFPPLRLVPEIQKSLPDKQAVLGFYSTGKRFYGFLMNNQRCNVWQVGTPATVLAQIRTVLRDMGQHGPNAKLPVKELTDVKWRRSAALMLDRLLKGSQADFSHPFDELVVVPDGALWYLPFEALQVTIAGKQQPLIAQVRVRYAPTLSLATPQGGPWNPAGNTVVIGEKLHAGDQKEAADAAFEQLSAVVPDAVMLKPPAPVSSSLYRVLFRRLIVLDDLTASDQDPYGWHPAPLEHGKTGGTLSDWLALPWGGPEVILLPGFHTSAEDAVRKARRTPPGNEIFLSVCGLMSTGARTVLLSRWRTSGQSSSDLIREFAQELPTASAADAWQRAVTLTNETRLNLEAEPRIERAPIDDVPKASHPFFWAGYLLIDSGSTPPKPEPRHEAPAADVKKPPKPREKNEPAAKPESLRKDA